MKILRVFLCGLLVVGLGIISSIAQEMPIYEWSRDYRRDSGHGLFSDYQSTTDGDGNVYISGVMNAVLDADPGTGVFNLTPTNSNYDDVFIIKLNALGIFQWAHKYNRLGAQNGPGDIVVDAAGNVFFASYYQLGFATNDTRLTKYDAAGNELWQKIIATKAWGGREITLDQSGNILMAGGFAGTVDFDPNAGVANLTASTTGTDNEMFLLKLTTDGDYMWAKRTSGPGSKVPRSIETDATGNIVIAGEYSGGVSDFDFAAGTANLTAVGAGDVFVLKLEEDGDFIWVRSMGGTDTDVAQAIATNVAGDIFLTGYFRGSADYDPTGGVMTLSTTLSTDIFIVRLGSDGSFGWATQFGGPGNFPDEGKAIAIDAAGNLLITGTFMGTVDFDPGAGVYNLVSTGTFLRGNAFLLKITGDKNLVWARAFGSSSTSDSMGTTVDIDNAGRITVVGHTNGSFQANFGPCNAGLGGSVTHAVIVKLRVGFEAQPTIISVSPASGTVGTQVTITGTNFGTNPADIELRFGNNRLATITAITPTSITTTVPPSSGTGQIYLKLKCFAGVLTPQTFVVGTPPTPTITNFTPASGNPGTTVTITGTNFSAAPANNTVMFNGTTAVVTSSSSTSITTTVPSGATTGKITVTVSGVTATSANTFTVPCAPLPPTITSFTPTSGVAGTSVTITGTNFSTVAGENVVAFNGTPAIVASGTTTSLIVTVPAGASPGPISVTTPCASTSSSTNFAFSTVITVNAAPSDITSCDGNAEVFSVNASGAQNMIYQWQFSPDGIMAYADVTNGSTYSNATTNQLKVNTVGTATAGFYRCRITGDYASDVFSNRAALTIDNGACAPVFSNAELITQPGGTIVIDLSQLITTTATLDLASIVVTTLPSSGATATITNGVLTILYSGTSFSGTETITVRACNTNGSCTEQTFDIEVVGEVQVYNALSPNGDNKNEILLLEFIDALPDTRHNQVFIFNRWGDEVFAISDYDNKTRAFSGISNNGNRLPSGVYYYKISLPDRNETLTGYLELRF
jgi:gliding motility-associated-like protein